MERASLDRLIGSLAAALVGQLTALTALCMTADASDGWPPGGLGLALLLLLFTCVYIVALRIVLARLRRPRFLWTVLAIAGGPVGCLATFFAICAWLAEREGHALVTETALSVEFESTHWS